jgi:hypothetical protein
VKAPSVHDAAAALGRLGGSRRTKRKILAARKNGRKGGWPPMGLVAWSSTYHGIAVGETHVRRFSRSSWCAALRAANLADGWGVQATMTEETSRVLQVTFGSKGALRILQGKVRRNLR